MTGDQSAEVRIVATRALGKTGSAAAARTLLHSLSRPAPVPEGVVASALLELGPEAVPGLRAELAGGRRQRAMAANVLGLLDELPAWEGLAENVGSGSVDVRASAVRALGRLGLPQAIGPVTACLHAAEDPLLRAAAAHALGRIGDPASARPLAACLADPHYWVAHNAAMALAEIGGPGLGELSLAAAGPGSGAAHAREALARRALARGERPAVPVPPPSRRTLPSQPGRPPVAPAWPPGRAAGSAGGSRHDPWPCLVLHRVLRRAQLRLPGASRACRGPRGAGPQPGRFAGLAEIFASPLAPPISLIVPVCNMADLIVGSTRGLLSLRYPEFEVIVVDDGSTDATFSRLQAEFGLVPVDKVIRDEARHGRPGALRARAARRRQPARDPQAGDRPPRRCGQRGRRRREVPADLPGRRRHLSGRRRPARRVAKPFIEDPAGVVAAGATIRVANGSGITSGRVTRPRVAGGWLLPIQAAEYLRSFLLGRAGWSQIRGMLFISGAFAVYRRDIYELAGGFDPGSDGDDLGMTLRVHRRLRDERQPYRVAFVPEPCCWRVVPHSYRRLAEQRTRWSRTLAEALWAQRAMLFNSGYGRIGLLVLPFYVLFELVSAVLELLAVVVFTAGLLLGFVGPELALLAAAAGLGYGALLTIASVICEELSYNRYHSWRDFALLSYAAVAENAGFRQLYAWWRLRGMAGAVLRHRATWAEEPGRRGQSEPAFGMPAGERHAGVP